MDSILPLKLYIEPLKEIRDILGFLYIPGVNVTRFYFSDYTSETLPNNEVQVLRYVGLKDKNNERIFENDIIKTSTGNMVVKYCPYCKAFEPFYLEAEGSLICGTCEGGILWEDVVEEPELEILGNLLTTEDFNILED